MRKWVCSPCSHHTHAPIVARTQLRQKRVSGYEGIRKATYCAHILTHSLTGKRSYVGLIVVETLIVAGFIKPRSEMGGRTSEVCATDTDAVSTPTCVGSACLETAGSDTS